MDEELRGTVEQDGGVELPNDESAIPVDGIISANEELTGIYYEPVTAIEETTGTYNEPVTAVEETTEIYNEPVTAVEETTGICYEPISAVEETTGIYNEPVSAGEEMVLVNEVLMNVPGSGRQEVWRHTSDSPYSPLYVPDKKQANKNRITIFMVGLLLVCLVCGLIAAVAKLVEVAMDEASSGISAWKEVYNEFMAELEEPEEEQSVWNEWKLVPEPDSEVLPDDFGLDEYEEYYDYEEYIPDPNDEFYVELADAIRNDLSYSIDKEEYTFTDQDKGVSISVEYPVIEGDNLAFKDKINEKIESGAMYYAREFASDQTTNFLLFVESYVTYMDESILSIVVSEEYYWEDEVKVDLYCMNFDLKTGALLYNTDIIEPTEELAGTFRDMSNYQNGSIAYIDELSDEDICAYLSDEDYLILFYTPVGLEIGFNYYEGWITATIKEYEKYLRKL